MGVIQNSLNQAIGAVAGSAIGIKHIKEQELSNVQQAENQALISQGQAENATREANEAYHAAKEPGGLIDQLANATTELGAAKDAAKAAKTPAEKLAARKSVKMAKNAFEKLRDEYSAVEGMMTRAEVMREHAAKMTDISEQKKARFARHWGTK